jgi:ATP-binding cassette subfamily F protein uup
LLLVSHDRDFLDRSVTSVIAFEGEGRWVEYAGGYSDMVAQRGHGVGALLQGKPAAPSAPRPAPPARRVSEPRKRLSPSEQHALKKLPARIAGLNEDIRRLEQRLAEPDFYASDRSGFAAAGAELAKVQEELAATEEDWLRLELLREEIQGA